LLNVKKSGGCVIGRVGSRVVSGLDMLLHLLLVTRLEAERRCEEADMFESSASMSLTQFAECTLAALEDTGSVRVTIPFIILQ
jgi:hypothetical protein